MPYFSIINAFCINCRLKKIKLAITLLIIVFIGISVSFPQSITVEKIEPPNWWIGMKWNTVQLMVYGTNLSRVEVSFNDIRLEVIDVRSVDNSNYLFVDVFIPDDIPEGEYPLTIKKGKEKINLEYPILSREISGESHSGFDNEDVIYLIFADRFCDGNPNNNIIGDSLDEFTSADIDGRKGGDIEGIISKLDYLQVLGITAIWITPLLENNMWMSYHGYAATDLYKIDPRFGSKELFKELVQEAHIHGIKVILDHVSNHIGINHSWINNLPMKEWLNGTPENHLNAHHDKMAFLDIHSDPTTVKLTTDGWFTNYMPDLNQRNPFLKKYLIQNTLWWIEHSGIDGIREDTYPYCDQKYLSDWAEAIMVEYPNFNIVGEIWTGIPSIISGYQNNSPVREHDFESNLPTVTDFAFADAVRLYLSGKKSIYEVYQTFTEDVVYNDPDNLVVFIDNHDMERAMYIANGNVDKVKLALNLVLFTRGIPVIFYGTEIGISGSRSHGELRQPFPGGFNGDVKNSFVQSERTELENELFDYLTELLKLRKAYPVLSKGEFRHIYNGGDLYVIIKTYKDEQAIVIMNTGEKDVTIQSSQVEMLLNNGKQLNDANSGKVIIFTEGESITVRGLTADIYLVEE